MLSKKSQYAFKALIYLSEKYKEGPVLISEIASKIAVMSAFFNLLSIYTNMYVLKIRSIIVDV